MFKFVYDIAQFELKFGLPHNSLFSDHVIIDVDIMNNISPRWIYSEGKPCVVGLLHKDRIWIYAAEDDKADYFKDNVARVIDEAGKIANIYAFNKEFAEGVLMPSHKMYELKPISGSGWNRDKCYQALRMHDVFKDKQEILDPFKGKETLTADYWEKYQATGEMQWLMEIIEHNLSGLLRGALIHNNRDWFPKKFKVNDRNFEVANNELP
jgi:hypothetical protein